MASLQLAFVAFFILKISCFSASELVVQLNVNRPLNDVNEKFISFIMKPEDLYSALDGPYRKHMTKMAVLMQNSYIKFLGDYDFTSQVNTNVKNPNKVIWKGFNRWSRAVNWTMIIPVPYQPVSWDPMQTLKILNNSHLVGINDCIWQLGTDFGSSHAADYVNELKTLDLMVDSFRPYVDKWQVMGADVSVGSSAEETKRYIEMSKDLNVAFGWTQPADLIPTQSHGSYIYEKDPALQILLSKKVPVWFSLPEKIVAKRTKNKSNRVSEEDTLEALRWAQTLGDAASNGFDVVFQRINNGDWERPDLSFYVTALYKKVMGSRVFPARPLNVFKPSNKLYTHCANAVSGGLAFMVVNTEEEPMHISLRTLTKLQGTTVWKYTLTTRKGVILLNNNRVYLNATFVPEVMKYSQSKRIQLNTPGTSISFWVFPSVNLDHCQFTEVAEEEKKPEEDDESDETNLTSTDKLLKSLIFESSLQNNPFVKKMNRERRYTTTSQRPKRFILQEQSVEKPLLSELFKPFTLNEKTVIKRENPIIDIQPTPFDWIKQLMQSPYQVPNLHSLKRQGRSIDKLFQGPLFESPLFQRPRALRKREGARSKRRNAALDWLKQLIEAPLKGAHFPLLKRQARSTDDFFGSSLFNNQKKTTAVTKKIFDIKKPEKKIKPIFEMEEFDEEEFFKKISDHTEPAYVRVPEGDIHIKHISTPEGDEVDIEGEEKRLYSKKKKASSSKASKEPKNEMKPLKLLPSEFYEGPSPQAPKPAEPKINIGATLNSLLFPEPFTKKSSTKDNSKLQSKVDDDKPEKDFVKKKVSSKKENEENLFTRDFLRSQRQLGKNFASKSLLEESLEGEDEETEIEEETDKIESPEESLEKPSKDDERNKFDKHLSIFGEAFDHLFAEKDLHSIKKASNQESTVEQNDDKKHSEEDDQEDPWWELSALRKKRSLGGNFISKDEDLLPLGASNIPFQVQSSSYNNENTDAAHNNNHSERSIVDSVQRKVAKIMTVVSRHVDDWYRAIAKRFATSHIEDSTMSNYISKF